MVTSTACVRTEKASRYLVQLCKHFGHKVPTRWSETDGFVEMPTGECRMLAEDGTLTLICEAADAAALGQMQDVVQDHLVRFAWKEELSVDWAPGETAG